MVDRHSLPGRQCHARTIIRCSTFLATSLLVECRARHPTRARHVVDIHGSCRLCLVFTLKSLCRWLAHQASLSGMDPFFPSATPEADAPLGIDTLAHNWPCVLPYMFPIGPDSPHSLHSEETQSHADTGVSALASNALAGRDFPAAVS